MPDPLLIVDMQTVFLKQSSHLIEAVQDLVAKWPEKDLYWLQYRNHPGSLFEKHLNWSDAIVSPDIDLIEGPGQDKKHVHYGYGPPPELIAHIQANYKRAYVCGMDTDACVFATMLRLWDNDIRPLLLTDYCASSGGGQFHDAALAIMQRQFGTDTLVKGVPRLSK
tara:strand:+ start:7085 stop:7582 length:498 start_codon:yes stop_codon:yes gene_type:complete